MRMLEEYFDICNGIVCEDEDVNGDISLTGINLVKNFYISVKIHVQSRTLDAS